MGEVEVGRREVVRDQGSQDSGPRPGKKRY